MAPSLIGGCKAKLAEPGWDGKALFRIGEHVRERTVNRREDRFNRRLVAPDANHRPERQGPDGIAIGGDSL
ncbi:hypothetical protein GCM10027089_26680 [Nocardia thraciensis]